MYPVSSYNKISQAAQPPPVHRRPPLTNAVNHVNHRETPPKPPLKAPSSPALPRQNPKVTPPSPPKIITDKSGKLQFHRVGFLGEVCGSVIQIGQVFLINSVQGGFARVYEVKDVQGSRLACKVVTKSSLKTKKAKTKVQTSIIHSINDSLIDSFSFTPKSRFTARSNIPILFISKIVSKTMTMST